MPYSSIKQGLRNVGFTTPTPFSEDADDVLYDLVGDHVQTLYAEGARLFVPCGNTGEYYALTTNEEIGIVKATVEAAGPDATVIGGVGGSTKKIIDQASEYNSVGADAIMLMHPDHTYMSEDGLLSCYRTIAESTDLAVVVYKRGPEITSDILVELSTIENIVGVKFAGNDVEEFSRTVRKASDDMVWITGSAERFAPSFAMEGAEGFTTGIGNFVPGSVLELEAALKEREWDRAMQIRDLLRPYERLRDESCSDSTFSAAKNVPAIKYGMEQRGMYGGPVRNPLTELTPADKDRASQYIDQIISRSWATSL